MKKTGSREEVYKGLAEKTKGGLKKANLKEKIIGKKIKYVSLRKSLRMTKNNPFKNKRPSSRKETKKERKRTRKVSFNMDDNQTKEYYCKEMANNGDDMFDTTKFDEKDDDVDFLKLHSQKADDFKIEDIGDLNLDSL